MCNNYLHIRESTVWREICHYRAWHLTGGVPSYVDMYYDNPCTKMAANYLSGYNLHQIAKKSTAAKMNIEMTWDKLFWQGGGGYLTGF